MIISRFLSPLQPFFFFFVNFSSVLCFLSHPYPPWVFIRILFDSFLCSSLPFKLLVFYSPLLPLSHFLLTLLPLTLNIFIILYLFPKLHLLPLAPIHSPLILTLFAKSSTSAPPRVVVLGGTLYFSIMQISSYSHFASIWTARLKGEEGARDGGGTVSNGGWRGEEEEEEH